MPTYIFYIYTYTHLRMIVFRRCKYDLNISVRHAIYPLSNAIADASDNRLNALSVQTII